MLDDVLSVRAVSMFASIGVRASERVERVLRAGSVRFLARDGILRAGLGGTPLLCITVVVLVDQVRNPYSISIHTTTVPPPPWHVAHASLKGGEPL